MGHLLLFTLYLCLSLALGVRVSDEGERLPREKFAHSRIASPHSSEWILEPNSSFLYQFHVGEQSWLAAREFCLSLNADLVSLKNKEQLDWLVSHYEPTWRTFSERFVQVGLVLEEGSTEQWKWLDGSALNTSITPWFSGEPFDHSEKGRERCGLLRVTSGVLDDVDCEETGDAQHLHRFICERSVQTHEQQQASGNFIMKKLDQLFKYFGMGAEQSTTEKPHVEGKNGTAEEDYWTQVETIVEEEKKLLKEAKSEEERQEVETHIVEKTLRWVDGTSTPSADDVSGNEVEETTSGEETSSGVESSGEASGEGESGESGETPEELTSDEPSTFAPTTLPPVCSFLKEMCQTPPEENVSTAEPASEPLISHDDELELQAAAAEAVAQSKKKESGQKSAPLQPLEEGEEGSGVKVETPNIEEVDLKKEAERLVTLHPKDDKELETVIIEMEKTLEKIDSLERTTTEEPRKDTQTVLKKELSEKSKAEIDTNTVDSQQSDIEDDFHHNATEVSSITPPSVTEEEEECDDEDEEGGGEEKKELSAEKEAQIQEFLVTLRQFLDRAQHRDLRQLLDNEGTNQTLIQRLKEAVRIANERELKKAAEIEAAMKKGENLNEVVLHSKRRQMQTEAPLMGDEEKEKLFQKISTALVGTMKEEAGEGKKEEEIETVTATEETLTTEENETTEIVAEETTEEPQKEIREGASSTEEQLQKIDESEGQEETTLAPGMELQSKRDSSEVEETRLPLTEEPIVVESTTVAEKKEEKSQKGKRRPRKKGLKPRKKAAIPEAEMSMESEVNSFEVLERPHNSWGNTHHMDFETMMSQGSNTEDGVTDKDEKETAVKKEAEKRGDASQITEQMKKNEEIRKEKDDDDEETPLNPLHHLERVIENVGQGFRRLLTARQQHL